MVVAPKCPWIPVFTLALALGACSKTDPAKIAEQKSQPPIRVVVVKAEKRQVPIEIRAIGNIEAFSAVDVKSQVAGPIARVAFEEGENVRKGQVLFEIDPRPFQQAVQQAEAELATRKAACPGRGKLSKRYCPIDERAIAGDSVCRAGSEWHHRPRTE